MVATESALLEALKTVVDPNTGSDFVSSRQLKNLRIDGGRVGFDVEIGYPAKSQHAALRESLVAAARRVAGVTDVDVRLTTKVVAHAVQRGVQLLPGVKNIVAVASGKGGVGKSTVAVNLAVALAQQGLRVGLLDADIYGPSLPRMLGLSRRPEVVNDKMLPLPAWGLKAMSIGFLVEEETPMIWRGPMVMGALEQMMGQVEWGPLDIMIVDMPPGTGDAQLTMAQRVTLAGAVIVSTPQDIALLDARRGVRMFEKTRVPVLGLIENMSFFCCPNCNHRSEIFGHGGARLEAQRLGAEFLGEIPLVLEIRTNADAGTPITAASPDSAPAQAFRTIAARLWEKVGGVDAKPSGPKITIS